MTRHTATMITLAAAAALAVGSWTVVTDSAAAYAAETCHGKPVTILIDSDANGPVTPGTHGDDVVVRESVERQRSELGDHGVEPVENAAFHVFDSISNHRQNEENSQI